MVDTFLAFLLPGHAAQVGKFFEHFVVTSMHTLVTKLKVYFAKQPNQWKKILNTLNELSTEQGVSMATIKQRFLPLLKGNPLLIDWFVQLFPTERAPEPRDDEFEEVQTKNELPFEEIPASLILAESGDSTSACAIKYMQGRIQYGNRYILPADLSFLATSYELKERVPKSVGERSSMRRGGKRGAVAVTEEATGGGARTEVAVDQEETTEVESPSKHPVGCVHAVGPAWDLRGSDETDDTGGAGMGQGGSGSGSNPLAKDNYQLCDAATLRAHMNRLNPALGATDGSGQGGAGVDEGGKGGSPKKQAAMEWKTQPILMKSRRASAAVSPKKAIGGSMSSSMSSSNALASVLEGSPKKPTEGMNKRKRQASSSSSRPVVEGEEEKKATTQLNQETKGGETESGEKECEWTREEDKILLEAINGQEDKTEEQILDELEVAIPGRLRAEINTRFQFLINILKKFS